MTVSALQGKEFSSIDSLESVLLNLLSYICNGRSLTPPSPKPSMLLLLKKFLPLPLDSHPWFPRVHELLPRSHYPVRRVPKLLDVSR